MTLSWISSRGNFCDGESSTEDITDHGWISKRQKHWHLHMTNVFTCRRDKQVVHEPNSHLGKFSNGKLRTSTLVNDGTLRSTAEFVSAISNVSIVKISDLLEFLVMFLFSSLCFQKVARLLKYPWGRIFFGNLKKISGRNFFPFLSSTLQKLT